MNNFTNGHEPPTKPLSATQSLKNELRAIIPDLPKDWRSRIKEIDGFYKTDKGNARLDNLRGGVVAPTLEELSFLKTLIKS